MSLMQAQIDANVLAAAARRERIAANADIIDVEEKKASARSALIKKLNSSIMASNTIISNAARSVAVLMEEDAKACAPYPTLDNGEAHGSQAGSKIGATIVLSCDAGFVLELKPVGEEDWPPTYSPSQDYSGAEEATVVCNPSMVWSDNTQYRCIRPPSSPTTSPSTTQTTSPTTSTSPTSTSQTTTGTTTSATTTVTTTPWPEGSVITVISDGTRGKPYCTWNKGPCVWDATVQNKCAKGLCEASGKRFVKFLKASNNFCTVSHVVGQSWFFMALTGGEAYQEGSWANDAEITALCTPG